MPEGEGSSYKGFCKTSFQVGMDLKNGQKQGMDERMQEYYPTCAKIHSRCRVAFWRFSFHALFVYFFRSIPTWNKVLQKPFSLLSVLMCALCWRWTLLVQECDRQETDDQCTKRNDECAKYKRWNVHIWMPAFVGKRLVFLKLINIEFIFLSVLTPHSERREEDELINVDKFQEKEPFPGKLIWTPAFVRRPHTAVLWSPKDPWRIDSFEANNVICLLTDVQPLKISGKSPVSACRKNCISYFEQYGLWLLR